MKVAKVVSAQRKVERALDRVAHLDNIIISKRALVEGAEAELLALLLPWGEVERGERPPRKGEYADIRIAEASLRTHLEEMDSLREERREAHSLVSALMEECARAEAGEG